MWLSESWFAPPWWLMGHGWELGLQRGWHQGLASLASLQPCPSWGLQGASGQVLVLISSHPHPTHIQAGQLLLQPCRQQEAQQRQAKAGLGGWGLDACPWPWEARQSC